MRVAVPVLSSRVSPRCVIATKLVIASLEGDVLRQREAIPLAVADEEELIELLIALHVDVLVCGGMRRELAAELTANGIRVIYNVVGEIPEVLDSLRRGALAPGHGLEPGPPRTSTRLENVCSPEDSLTAVDCMACASRECLASLPCPHGGAAGMASPMRYSEARIYEVGRDVSAETDPNLCRIAELVHFAKGLGYRKIGLAFCWELFREVETLAGVLSRFFEVVPVCCRVASTPENGMRYIPGESPSCSPVLQAELLNEARTELNVVAGLCMGSDLLFSARSRAPTTTLFVKDRSLAHNPVGAIYTRYHLEELERTSASAGRSGRI